MKKFIKERNKEKVNKKSIKEIMENGYKTTEASGFYTPIKKNEWDDNK